MKQAHFFYLARCTDGSLYAGTCVSLEEREQMHNDGKGAKYTRSRQPITIMYHEIFESLSKARRREALVKRWTKLQKEKLIATARAGSSQSPRRRSPSR